MKFMLLIYAAENAITDEERQHCYVESTELTHELSARGQYLAASPLQSAATATTVRIREGKRMVTDGPFAETRELLGGYFLIEVKDLNEAIAVARRIPAARWGTVEVRPVVELTGLPKKRSAPSRPA
ncbi:MAG: YciI family protein [Pirellulales bacterium]|nr:YciI family protein [Pirellulales bacterium]